MNLLATTFTFETATFVPLAIGFFGLGVGYLTWGGLAFLGWPRVNPAVPEESELAINRSLGLWGIWMPGFMQFLTGLYLAVGLTWFKVFDAKPLMMAALAFTAFGVHWSGCVHGARLCSTFDSGRARLLARRRPADVRALRRSVAGLPDRDPHAVQAPPGRREARRLLAARHRLVAHVPHVRRHSRPDQRLGQ